MDVLHVESCNIFSLIFDLFHRKKMKNLLVTRIEPTFIRLLLVNTNHHAKLYYVMLKAHEKIILRNNFRPKYRVKWVNG